MRNLLALYLRSLTPLDVDEMIDEKLIRGAGGGGKAGGWSKNAIEEDDSLNQNSSSASLICSSEGEIEGLDDNAKSIFLDDTPVQNADGSTNFDNFTIARALWHANSSPHS